MIKQLRRLSRESAPHLVNCLSNLCRSSIQTWIARGLAWWWRVALGRSCRFYGLPFFRRLPGSRIRIGGNCQFRSGRRSNLLGINRPCMISTISETAVVEIGAGCGFSGVVIGSASRIVIGERVLCGANVTITDSDWHPIEPRKRLASEPGAAAPVTIHDDVWLGMNVIVLKGVEIGRGTVVGAGSIVSHSLPAEVIAAGQPAVAIRRLTGDEGFSPASAAVLHGAGGI